MTSSVSDLQEVARQLYSAPPEEFVKERTRSVKQARADRDRDLAKEIGRLRKPTAAGWLLNSLVRHRGEEVQQVLTLGADLREAQSNLDPDQLRALSSQRRQLIEAIGRQATLFAAECGHRVSDQVAREIEGSLQAAMADPAAARALCTGLLTDSFMSTGLDPVDLQGVVAVPAAEPLIQGPVPEPPPTERPEPDQSELLAAQQQLEEAQAIANEVAERAREACRATADAQARVDSLVEERRKLEDRLQHLEREISAAEGAQTAAVREQEKADREEGAARRFVELARAEVEKLG